MEFSVYRFGDFCKMFAGGDAPKDYMLSRTKEKCYPVYSNGIENEGLYGYCDCYTMPGNTLTISARGTVGVVFYRCESFLPIVRLIALVVDEKIADTRYIYYLLKCGRIDGYGTSQQQITIPYLKKKRIQIITSLDKQKKIASILSAYDNLIEVNNKRIKVLEQMAENLYKEWFVRFRFPGHEKAEFENGIPKGWSKQRLDQFGISLDSGSRPSGGIDDSLNEGIPSLGAESVNGMGEFDYNDVKLIPFDYYQKMKRGKSTGSDILVYKDGEYIGKTTIFMNAFPFSQFAVNEHVFLLNANSSEYQLYLYFTLHLQEYYILMQNLNRNAAQPGLSKPDMNRIKIVVPDITTVQKFNAIVKPIMNQVFHLASQRYNLTKQRDLLLPRLMSGKLEV